MKIAAVSPPFWTGTASATTGTLDTVMTDEIPGFPARRSARSGAYPGSVAGGNPGLALYAFKGEPERLTSAPP